MERSTLKAVIDLVDVNQLVYLSQLSEDRAVEESMALFSSYGTYIKTQKSNLLQKLFLQSAYSGKIYSTCCHGHNLDNGDSISRRSANAWWHSIQVVGLYAKDIIHLAYASWPCWTYISIVPYEQQHEILVEDFHIHIYPYIRIKIPVDTSQREYMQLK